MTSPYDDPAPSCVHAITLDGHTCGRAPAVHIAVYTGSSDAIALGPITLPSCRRHAAIARAAGELLAEHPYTYRCDEGGCWPINANRIPDDRDRQPRRDGTTLGPRADRALKAVIVACSAVAAVLLLLGIIHLILGGTP